MFACLLNVGGMRRIYFNYYKKTGRGRERCIEEEQGARPARGESSCADEWGRYERVSENPTGPSQEHKMMEKAENGQDYGNRRT